MNTVKKPSLDDAMGRLNEARANELKEEKFTFKPL